ncbi:BamA/TamA family outer membrane protein [bacterium]|nr:BamA/TamA family outer membrane protein [bacterium]
MKKLSSPFLHILILFISLVTFYSIQALAKPLVKTPPAPEQKKEEPKKGKFDFFKNREFDIFPVPVWESRPDKGNTYGLMPVVLLSDKKDGAIKAILAVIGQYNSVFKVSGAALAYLYPTPESEITFYGEMAQDYLKEFALRYFNPHLTSKIYLETEAQLLHTPFGYFYGIGPTTKESAQSNFFSKNINLKAHTGYYLKPNLRIEGGFRFNDVRLHDRAVDDYPASLTLFAGNPKVTSAKNLKTDIGLVFDNRTNSEYSDKGTLASLMSSYSFDGFLSDNTFQALDFEISHILPIIKNRWKSVFRFHTQGVWGNNIPFYEQSAIGGPTELRSFVPGRFIDSSKMVFQIEQRIKVADLKVMGKKFSVNADPFFEVGRVFPSWNHINTNNWQPVGGLGIRAFVPPNVIGRIDMAYGKEGFEIYTGLGYPF